jgi:hypothetical protein
MKVRYAGANLPFDQRESKAASGPLRPFVQFAANGGNEPKLSISAYRLNDRNERKCIHIGQWLRPSPEFGNQIIDDLPM